MGTNEVFVSYARSDRSVLKGLFDSLKVVQQHHSVGVWDDSKIPAGADWRQEIENQMSAARIAILAVSPAFLSSDFITRVELPKLLGQAKLKGTLACVIHVRPAAFDLVESLERLQALNDPKQTVVELRAPERERFWAKVARFVRDQLATGNSTHESPKLAFSKTHARLSRYLLVAKDLEQAFTYHLERAAYSKEAEEDLTKALVDYNQSASDLVANHPLYAAELAETAPILSSDVERLYALVVEEVHPHALRLNDAIAELNLTFDGRIADADRLGHHSKVCDLMRPVLRNFRLEVDRLSSRLQTTVRLVQGNL